MDLGTNKPKHPTPLNQWCKCLVEGFETPNSSDSDSSWPNRITGYPTSGAQPIADWDVGAHN